MALILTILGISLILFVHEGGHYLAARRCGVRVEVFSLGFGPRLFGWRSGDTDYRISLLPLGGYVKLAGEGQNGTCQPGDLGAASTNQRLLIFAGGILMNFLFALLVIPLLFRFGVSFEVPVVGEVTPGSPAWEAGLREGDRLATVDGNDIYAFRTFAAAIALGDQEHIKVEITNRNGGDALVPLIITPKYDPEVGFRRVGIAPASFDPKLEVTVDEDSSAWRAGLRPGDRLVSINGVACQDYQSTRILLQDAALSASSIDLGYWRQNNSSQQAGEQPSFGSALLKFSAPNADSPIQVGIRRAANRVRQVRGSKLLPFEQNDIILSAAGKKIQRLNDLAAVSLRDSGLPSCQVLRDGNIITTPADPQIKANDLLELLWMDEGDDFRVALVPGSPASKVLKEGDILLQVSGQPIFGLEDLRARVDTSAGQAIDFTIARFGETDPLLLKITPAPIGVLNAGFSLKPWYEIVRRDNVIDALSLGVREAHRMVKEMGATISGMVSGRVASDNIGGIITIGRVAHNFATAGLGQLFFFLAMISIHLGIINLLPIPALDGGHILFVLLEKLRGKPISLHVQGVFNLVGIALLLGLIVFATRNDLRLLFG